MLFETRGHYIYIYSFPELSATRDPAPTQRPLLCSRANAHFVNVLSRCSPMLPRCSLRAPPQPLLPLQLSLRSCKSKREHPFSAGQREADYGFTDRPPCYPTRVLTTPGPVGLSRWPLRKTKEADVSCFPSSVLALCKRESRFYLHPLRSTPNSSVLVPCGHGPTRSAGGRFMGESYR